MKFTVQPVFHPAVYGLPGPRLAVLSDLPDDLGGELCVVDLFADDGTSSPARLAACFERAARLMPYKVDDDGLRIEFMAENPDGGLRRQPTLYAPRLALTGQTMTDCYLEWLCYRARVDVWSAERDRVALTPDSETHLLNTLKRASHLRLVDALPATSVPGFAMPALTRRRAPV